MLRGEIHIDLNLPDKTITLKVDYSDKVENVKVMISDKEHIPPDQQALTFDGMILQDKFTIGDYLYNSSTAFTLDLLVVKDKATSTLCQRMINQGLEKQKKHLEHQMRVKKQFLLQQQLKDQKHQTMALQEILHEQELLSTDLKLALHIEKEQIKT